MPRGSEELTNARKEEIVNACAALYETMSFRDITLRDIGNKTSFTRTSIYNYFITIFIPTRKCFIFRCFRYLSSNLLHFYSNFKPRFSIQLLRLFSFLLKRVYINLSSLPTWNDLKVSVPPVGLLHFHSTL